MTAEEKAAAVIEALDNGSDCADCGQRVPYYNVAKYNMLSQPRVERDEFFACLCGQYWFLIFDDATDELMSDSRT